jgi:hypothetical protein
LDFRFWIERIGVAECRYEFAPQPPILGAFDPQSPPELGDFGGIQKWGNPAFILQFSNARESLVIKKMFDKSNLSPARVRGRGIRQLSLDHLRKPLPKGAPLQEFEDTFQTSFKDSAK